MHRHQQDLTPWGVGLLLLILILQVAVSKANADEIDDVADSVGVDSIDLRGAVNTTGLSPLDYLSQVGEDPRHSNTVNKLYVRVRLTYYVLRGTTATGEGVHLGGTACSSNFRLQTQFRLPTGETLRCNDRGLLGSTGWLDVWGRPDLIRQLGDYTTVEVLP